MKPKKRQKLCANCDGEIDLDVIVCPFCAADLREEVVHGQRHAVRSIPVVEGNEEEAFGTRSEEAKGGVVGEASPLSGMVGTVLLLTAGTQLLILGILLVLLSSHGVVTLKWDARLWFLYVFASIPFLIFGYRSMSKI